jgi:hypothetical protein
MATATKKTNAVKKEVTAEKPKAVKKPKVETQSTEGKDVRNVQVHLTKEKKVSVDSKVYKTATPLKNDSLVLHKVNSIEKAKNWIKRLLRVKK